MTYPFNRLTVSLSSNQPHWFADSDKRLIRQPMKILPNVYKIDLLNSLQYIELKFRVLFSISFKGNAEILESNILGKFLPQWPHNALPLCVGRFQECKNLNSYFSFPEAIINKSIMRGILIVRLNRHQNCLFSFVWSPNSKVDNILGTKTVHRSEIYKTLGRSNLFSIRRQLDPSDKDVALNHAIRTWSRFPLF